MRTPPLVLAAATLALVLTPVVAHANPAGAPRDTAKATGNNFIVDDFSSYAIDVEAFSDPAGAHPGGEVSFLVGALQYPVSAEVTCLEVSGNVATIGIEGPLPSFPGFLGFIIRLTDNGGGGHDRFDYFPILPEFEPDVDCLRGTPGYFGGRLDGRAIVSDADACGAGDPPPCADTSPPETSIADRPPNRIERRRARFAFRSNEAGSSFECRLDGSAFEPCSSPVKLRRLQPGRHRLGVRAIDAAGNADESPARDRFKVLD